MGKRCGIWAQRHDLVALCSCKREKLKTLHVFGLHRARHVSPPLFCGFLSTPPLEIVLHFWVPEDGLIAVWTDENITGTFAQSVSLPLASFREESILHKWNSDACGHARCGPARTYLLQVSCFWLILKMFMIEDFRKIIFPLEKKKNPKVRCCTFQQDHFCTQEMLTLNGNKVSEIFTLHTVVSQRKCLGSSVKTDSP